ncbi:hypothetical protein NA78x_004675 [Anatilimnocola sp. NA78]|uniref:hypothetical protein n=1 Tax=Anatilimnocola sp. NA78 TaxID=3415683 RepID=UPI003CE55322
MTTRQELLDYWQQRLADSEHAGGQGFAWTDRLRLKLYRFLLAMYGQSEWPGSKDDVDNEIGRTLNSSLMVADTSEISTGKAPRTRAEILKSLQSVKGLSDELAPPGPLQHGLEPNSPVVVAANRKRVKAERVARYLEKQNIPIEVRYAGSLWQIFVRQCDAAKAAAIIAELVPVASQSRFQVSSARARLPIRTRVFFRAAILFGLFGLLFSILFGSQLLGETGQGPTTSADRIAVVGTAAAVFGMLFLICLYYDVKGHYQALRQRELLDQHHV